MQFQQLRVRCATIETTAALVNAVEEVNQKQHFQPLARALLATLEAALESGDATLSVKSVEWLTSIAEESSIFFEKVLKDTWHIALQFSGNCVVPDSVRHMGVELLLTLAEESTPSKIRKLSASVDAMLNILMELLVTVF